MEEKQSTHSVPRKINDLERRAGRSEDFYQLSAEEQWEQDKALGILDWDGTEEWLLGR